MSDRVRRQREEEIEREYGRQVDPDSRLVREGNQLSAEMGSGHKAFQRDRKTHIMGDEGLISGQDTELSDELEDSSRDRILKKLKARQAMNALLKEKGMGDRPDEFTDEDVARMEKFNAIEKARRMGEAGAITDKDVQNLAGGPKRFGNINRMFDDQMNEEKKRRLMEERLKKERDGM